MLFIQVTRKSGNVDSPRVSKRPRSVQTGLVPGFGDRRRDAPARGAWMVVFRCFHRKTTILGRWLLYMFICFIPRFDFYADWDVDGMDSGELVCRLCGGSHSFG